jgi:hypothetical protein
VIMFSGDSGAGLYDRDRDATSTITRGASGWRYPAHIGRDKETAVVVSVWTLRDMASAARTPAKREIFSLF